ncbi:hypothetical protein FM104_00200 [Microbacterium esteraromaticum]|uniref:DNA modification methylase n=1 Tax=Microbacterium esteraromaticum TaxID=57043 RepID=A0A1R4I6J5_9MICO|nr:hypothetical protein [Microbacterium esteraromaticum]SJN15369.1 hypothetical protein FM104_00200 [Microbacterium esteraromaticum]
MNSRSVASLASRLVAVVALGAAVALGTTGCTFITHQATLNQYPASDGVNIESTGGPIVVRNALIIANEDGSAGNLVAAFINESDKSANLNIDIDGERLNMRVPAGERVSLGADADPLLIENLGVKPGATVEILFVSGDGDATPSQVPVLDGTLKQYADLVPMDAEDAG